MKNLSTGLGIAALAILCTLLYAPTEETHLLGATMEVRAFVDTSTNVSAIRFCGIGLAGCDPGTQYNPANESVGLTNTPNSNTAVDVYLNNTNMSNGSNQIRYNYTYVNTVNVNTTSKQLNGSTYINGTSANTGYVENLAAGSTVTLYFWQGVPPGTPAGIYTSTINIRTVKDGDAP